MKRFFCVSEAANLGTTLSLIASNTGITVLENLSLIPGEVGASAVQNVGAYGVEAGDCIERVETVEMATGREWVFSHDDCQYAYRSSFFKHEAHIALL